MRICINANGPDQSGGYFTYITNLIDQLSRLDSKNQYIIISNGKIHNHFKNLGKNFITIKSSKLHNYNIYRFLWMQFLLPFITFFYRSTILFSPLNATPFLLKMTKIKSVMVIHSNIPWINSEFLPYGSFKASIIKTLKSISIRFSDAVICVSEFAKKELLNYLKINESRIHTIYLGINRMSSNKIDYQNPYLLYVANSALHHNHINLIKGFKKFSDNNKKIYRLFLVLDPVDIKNYKLVIDTINEYNISKIVKIISPMNMQKLYELYSSASLYIFPSLCETFGMTTLEAMSCGVPVICSNASAIPEVNGDAAIYFDPLDTNDIADKISYTISNQDLCSTLINKGYERVRYFSWEKTAKKTISIFEELSSK